MWQVPVAMVLPLLFGCIVYPALRLQRDLRRFALFLAILVLNAFAATSLGLAVSAASPSIQVLNPKPLPIIPQIIASNHVSTLPQPRPHACRL